MNYNNIYLKYLKYKKKYLELKKNNQILNNIGGNIPIIRKPLLINLFIDERIENYLNPIYGKIMYETNYYINIYYLVKSGLVNYMNEQINLLSVEDNILYPTITNGEIQIIKKIFNTSLNNKMPTKKLLSITPYEYGKHMGLKYIYLNNMENFDILESLVESDKLVEYFAYTNNDINCFHLTLYSLWWVLDNDDGIIEYYKGVKEVFKQIYDNEQMELLFKNPDTLDNNLNTFEKTIFDIIQEPFTLFEQEEPNNFCKNNISKKNYPDCVEITIRNLINFLTCSDGVNFNIDKLDIFNPIDKLKEYYSVYKDFDSQVSNKSNIFDGEKLTPYDAWSKLIIFYANTNIDFVNKCENPTTFIDTHEYEVNTGLSKDYSVDNIFQLVKNLLPGLTSWEDLKKIIYIDDIQTNVNENYKNIFINHNINGYLNITIYPKHVETNINNKKTIVYNNNNNFNQLQKDKLDLLINENINLKNILSFRHDYTFMKNIFNYNGFRIIHTDSKIKLLLLIFILGLDFNNRIFNNVQQIDDYDNYYYDDINFSDFQINVKSDYYTKFIYDLNNNQYLKKYKNSIINKIEKFTWICWDFNFVYNLPWLTKINLIFMDREIESIDANFIKPLKNIKVIESSFLSDYHKLKYLDLSPLRNLNSFPDNTLRGSRNLIYLNLSGLSFINSLPNDFLCDCKKIVELNLSGMKKLKSLPNNFLYDCKNLIKLDLYGLTNLETIGNKFLYKCVNLTELDLSSLTNLKSVGKYFLYKCDKLESIILPQIDNITWNDMNDYIRIKNKIKK